MSSYRIVAVVFVVVNNFPERYFVEQYQACTAPLFVVPKTVFALDSLCVIHRHYFTFHDFH